jgi:hypothetical protein
VFERRLKTAAYEVFLCLSLRLCALYVEFDEIILFSRLSGKGAVKPVCA